MFKNGGKVNKTYEVNNGTRSMKRWQRDGFPYDHCLGNTALFHHPSHTLDKIRSIFAKEETEAEIGK